MGAARAPRRIAVVGLGSVLQGDDGAGIAAVKALEAGWEIPASVAVLDLGTPGPYLAEHLRGYDDLILVDAVRAAGPPGSIWRFDRHEILAARPLGPRVSPHDPGVAEALRRLALEGLAPGAVLLGIVPGSDRVGTELSGAVAAAIDRLAGRIADELAALGAPAARRDDPLPAACWWTRPTAAAPLPF